MIHFLILNSRFSDLKGRRTFALCKWNLPSHIINSYKFKKNSEITLFQISLSNKKWLLLGNHYKEPFLVKSKILGLLVNTLTTDHEHSRGNRKNLLLPIQMQIFKNSKIFCSIFIAFLESTLNFGHKHEQVWKWAY